ncbi:hypothetical protein LMH66_07270 [Shewanella sp. 10N.7]|uniref:hypothetical protein n=1 Tax=Shewanella sp. 10N.7 TaxID=2885093 RepID=UPI001E38651D|nr:hypothetical protein [Shewanella sp. 10N.7]MCC4832429.1 hypothetical protein [Shewanella sp. 10N.7]
MDKLSDKSGYLVITAITLLGLVYNIIDKDIIGSTIFLVLVIAIASTAVIKKVINAKSPK